MIGQFEINCCPVLDNFGKKDGGVVLAVYGYSVLGMFFHPACITAFSTSVFRIESIDPQYS
jgi:hypothetical protein